jgi:hypothetical protein
MDLSTKPIQRDSLRELIDASSRSGTAHAHVVRRDSVRRQAIPMREPSALRGLVLVLVLAFAVRQLLLWLF